MGWSFRKSINLGPFRINMGSSGVGYSIGGKGFRTGVNSQGRSYSSVSIPGTGIRYTTNGNAASKQQPGACGTCCGCIVIFVLLIMFLQAIGFVAK